MIKISAIYVKKKYEKYHSQFILSYYGTPFMLYMTIKKDFYDLNKLKSKDMMHSKVVGREVLYRNVCNKKYSSMGIAIKTRLKGIKV
jgi:hypothetical protein